MAEYDKNGYITKLDKNEIFVFGSNGQGAHLGGAAASAVHKFGAKMGQAEGLQGQSYAINTMDSEDEMFAQIERFIHFAEKHPELKFYVTEIGCGIAGYSPEEIAPKFAYYYNQNNIILPESFIKANKKLMNDLFDGKKTILFFEHAEPGAMGGNLGGVIFWYLDRGKLKTWQSFRNDEFFELYTEHCADFAYVYAGFGNYAHFNKKSTFIDKKSDLEFSLNYKGKEYRIAGHCTGITHAITEALKPDTNFEKFEQKEAPPRYMMTTKELEKQRKKLTEIRKQFEAEKSKLDNPNDAILKYEITWTCTGDHYGWGHTRYRVYSDRHIEKELKDVKSDDKAAGLGYLRNIGEWHSFVITDSEYQKLTKMLEKAVEPLKGDMSDFIRCYDGVDFSITQYDQVGSISLSGNIVDESIEHIASQMIRRLSTKYLGLTSDPKKYRTDIFE